MKNVQVKSLLERIASRQKSDSGAAVATEIGEHGDDTLIFKKSSLETEISMSDIKKEISDEKSGFSIPFIISDSEVDRDNDKVYAKGMELDNFLGAKAPVLFAHNQRDLPVAKAPNTKRTGQKLKSEAEFPAADLSEFGNMIGRMVLNDFLGAASIGFLPKEWKFMDERGDWAVDFVKAELLEWSIVPVPANPRAVAGAKSFGINVEPLIEWCEKALDEDGAIFVPRNSLEEARKAANGGRIVVPVPGGWELVKSAETTPDTADEVNVDDLVKTKEGSLADESAEDEIPEEAEIAFVANDLIAAMTKFTETLSDFDERITQIESSSLIEDAKEVSAADPVVEDADDGVTPEEAERIVADVIAARKSAQNQQAGELPDF